MKKKLAIAVVHGIGTYNVKEGEATDVPRFSHKLKARILKSMPRSGKYPHRRNVMEDVAWREVRYNHVFEDVQSDFLGRIEPSVKWKSARKLMVQNIGDAASYRHDRRGNPNTYQRVNACMAATLAELEEDVEPGAPLIIMAHSLGGHVTTNYLWDMTEGREANDTRFSAFQRGRTLCSLITFGCNIPLFLLGIPSDHVQALPNPGTACPERLKEDAWWLNFYDKDDPLGYPLGLWGQGYENMKRNGALVDQDVDVGDLFQRWNLLSHNGYWTGRDFYRPAAARIRRALAALGETSSEA